MQEYYSILEIRKLFDPPVSNHFLLTLKNKGKMPHPIKRTEKGFIFDKKEIDEWFSKGIVKGKCGRKPGVLQGKMSKENYDIWNIRKNNNKIEFSKEYSEVIRFLQPSLKNRNIGNALGS